jgi:hypothetical protein
MQSGKESDTICFFENCSHLYGATKEFSKKSPTLSTVFPVFIVIFSHVENPSSSNIVRASNTQACSERGSFKIMHILCKII